MKGGREEGTHCLPGSSEKLIPFSEETADVQQCLQSDFSIILFCYIKVKLNIFLFGQWCAHKECFLEDHLRTHISRCPFSLGAKVWTHELLLSWCFPPLRPLCGFVSFCWITVIYHFNEYNKVTT